METSNLSEIRLDEETLPELRSLTHALNEMLERLSRGFDAQRQFVGNAAHELRTPLTLLQTQLELFPDEHPDIPPESAAFLAALQDEVQRLSRLTHALLDMSDLQSVPRNDVILLSPMIDEVFASPRWPSATGFPSRVKGRILLLSAAICCFAVCFPTWWRMPSNTTIPAVW